MKKIILAGLAISSFPAFSQMENASIIVRPAFELPIGKRSTVFNKDALYTPGGYATVNLQYIMPDFSNFY